MLSYRHSYHAGNHADVLKHLTEVAILDYLLQKEKPLCYHDTHAGAGLYSLTGEQAQKTAEFEAGIGKLWGYQASSPLLQKYLQLIAALNSDGELQFYPGSPKIAAMLLRPQDQLQATELHPTDFPLLKTQFQQRRLTRIEQMDAYAGFKAMLPPQSKRGLVLIDPPYELKTEYQDLISGLHEAYRRFPQATYAIWYPVIERTSVEQFISAIVATGIKNQLRIEFTLQPDSPGFGMTGSGMLVINPPFNLATTLQPALEEVLQLMGQTHSTFQIMQIVGE